MAWFALAALVAVIAVVALVALVAVLAVVALPAEVACVALGTSPSVAALICFPVSEPGLTFEPVTAALASFAPVTAPLRSCLVPTELCGSLVAAYAVPDMAMKIAISPSALRRANAMILATM